MATFITVHSDRPKTVYKSRLCSKAFLFFVICVILTLVLPFLVAYSSQGFWKRTDTYREQPDVNWKHELLVVLETLDDTSYICWSTFPRFNSLVEDHLRVPSINSREEDKDGDGRNDELSLRLEFPVTEAEKIVSIKLMLFFNYKLSKFSRLELEGMAYLTYGSPKSGSEYHVIGDLGLHQRVLLGHTGINSDYNTSIVDWDSIYAETYSLHHILKSYSDRDVTTVLGNIYEVWMSARGPDEPFIIAAHVRYPEQTISYKPSFWNIMKTAWIQYLAVLVVFTYGFATVKSYVFGNQIIQTIVESQFKICKIHKN